MGVFSKVGGWLTDKSNQFIRGDAEIPGSYYASDEAEAAYGGLRGGADEPSATARRQPVSPFGGDAEDEYGGRVPYRSKNQGQNTASFARVTPGQTTGSFQAVTPGQTTGSYPPANPLQATGSYPPVNPMQATGAYPPVNPAQATASYPPAAQATSSFPPVNPQNPYAGYTPNTPPAQPPQQPQGQYRSNYATPPQGGNCVPFPNMQVGPDGAPYTHMEYIVLLRTRNECKNVIEYIKQNASVFLNMEFIESVSERQRCVDMLSGAAYTLGCKLNKISPRGIYLISSPAVRVIIDQAMQRFAAEPEARGYARQGYPQEQAAYAAPQGGMPMGRPLQQNFGFAPATPETQPYTAEPEPAQPMFRQRPANPFSQKASGAYGQRQEADNQPSFQTPASAGFGKRSGAYQQ